MILYFSGTGNSKFVAERIAGKVGDDSVNLFDKIRNNDYSRVRSDRPFVFVTPTYAWQIPHIVRDWIGHTKFGGNRMAYFVMTCGGDNGNAGKYVKELCGKKGFDFMGCVSVIMPENYIAMFSAPAEEESKKIIQKAIPEIDAVAEKIVMAQRLPAKDASWKDKLSSSAVNAVFYPMFLHDKKFRVSDSCVGCGKCADSCPMGNIKITDGKPVWGGNCTHCMACICGCPKEAIEYGKKSEGQPRYQCPM